jgi:phosphatidate phosphatase APP1
MIIDFGLGSIPLAGDIFDVGWKANRRDMRLLRRYATIGDGAQHDPEIYARIVRENPDRVKAIYIRNVNRDPARRLFD